jgi:sulfate transport system permease protein
MKPISLHWKKPSVLPGFGLAMGFTILYLSLLVLIPLAALVVKSGTLGWPKFWEAASDARVVAAYKLSFGASLAAATLNALFGFIVAWVLVRYTFPGKRFLDAMVDLPFALPTAVSGIALASLYDRSGWIGHWLDPLGIDVTGTRLAVVVALTFIGLPFVVRTLQPALEDLDPEIEEAAASLGAGRLQTFVRVILPTVLPSLLTGFALALARAIGEYGSVIFIAGNLPMYSEIVPKLIFQKLDHFDYVGATAIGVVMLAASFVMLLLINLLQWWSRRGIEDSG